MSNKILFEGELQITAWGDSSTSGPWVKFWVHPEDLEHFKLLEPRTGKKAGQRIGAVMVQINDDETVVQEEPSATPAPTPAPRRYHPPSVGPLGMLAVRWCKDPNFQRWAADQWGDVNPLSEDDAKDYILKACGITPDRFAVPSRKHLDTDPLAGQLFQEEIRHPFMDYQRQKGLIE